METPPAGAALLSPSRQLGSLIASLKKRAEGGQTPRVLLCGPASSRTIETFHSIGCRVTVEGDDHPSVPLAAADESFELILGYDALDTVDDVDAQAIAVEWTRALKPGGKLYLLARREKGTIPPVKVDINEDGSLRLHLLSGDTRVVHPRQNADFTRLTRPLSVEEIFQRRDGLREILCKKG